MTKFATGDLVTGKPNNDYYITSNYALMLVEKILSDEEMTVRIIMHRDSEHVSSKWRVYMDHFTKTTIKAFEEEFGIFADPEVLARFGIKRPECEIMGISNVMNERIVECEDFDISGDDYNEIASTMKWLYGKYNHSYTDDGIEAQLEEWKGNKGPLIKLMEKHPNYNGKFQITFDADYSRQQDSLIIYNCIEEIMSLLKEKPLNTGGVNIANSGIYLSNCRDECFRKAFGFNVTVESGTGRVYKSEDYKKNDLIGKCLGYFRRYLETTVNDDMAEFFKCLPQARVKKGQKTSRVFNEVCIQLGAGVKREKGRIDYIEGYSRLFAKYSDAINPLKIRRHTVISANPIDYLTMSFGNSWASCHTIDKENERGMENAYHGQYCSGTLSYMLDETSLVFYTVDKSYDGDCLELEPKITRNMFHIGEDKIVQGRVYPQCTDGASNIYTENREIMQKVFSDILNVPNRWLNKKGTSDCNTVINSKGTHYRDYLNFSDCNVSTLNVDGFGKNRKRITVGHDPICPNCGEEHNLKETLNCYDCRNPKYECESCGWENRDIDEFYEYEGRLYCYDCTTYCNYHNRREPNERLNFTYIGRYGDVCEDALRYSDNFQNCLECDDWLCVDGDSTYEVSTSEGYCCCRVCLNEWESSLQEMLDECEEEA